MGNQIRYGNYTHDEGEVEFEISQVIKFNTDAGYAQTMTQFWTLSGELIVDDGSDNQAALTTAIQQLEAAYSVQGLDLVFLLNTGGNSAHLIRSSASIGGTKVRYLDWIATPGGYSNHRKYRIGLEAEFPLATRTQLTYWTETIEFSGGGPKDRHQESVKGLPRKQRIKRNTVFRARQFGDIIGLYSFPSWPQPIWPGAELRDLRVRRSGSPKPTGVAGEQFKDFPRSYSYEFENATSLFGQPGFWFVA